MQDKFINECDEGKIWKGLVAGLVGGLVAAWTMNQFQALVHNLFEGDQRSHGAQSMQKGSPQHGAGQELREQGGDEEQDDATERLANIISKTVLDHELSKKEKETAGTAIHYAFGIASGGFYGAAAELLPKITLGAGLPFGAFVWLTADEGVVPLFGLSKAPTEYPFSTHAYALTSHIVYGLTADCVRRLVRRSL